MDGGALASPIGATATAVAPTTPKGKVTVRLTPRTARTLKHRKRLRVGVRMRFAPSSGVVSTRTVAVTVKAR